MKRSKFIKYARRTIRVIWLGRKIKPKDFEKIIRQSKTKLDVYYLMDWKEFSRTVYIPRYRKDWHYPNDKPYKINEFLNKARRSKEFEKKRMKNFTVIVAYDTYLNKKVLVDGNHRVISCYLKNVFPLRPPLKVIEISGPMIHVIFPCEFGNFI